MTYENILVEKRDGVALITLNRPKAMNALSPELFQDLKNALNDIDNDDTIGATVITGNDKAFAAGADIKAMRDKTYKQMYVDNVVSKNWDCIAECRKPIIAAVAGYALGAGCEIAMMCDFIIAAENVKFGQPEVTIGTMPGMGGTQRLTRLIGKSKAMDMCLTARMMDAAEAERAGLVSRIVPLESYLEVALDAAKTIASFSRPAIMLIKDAVDMALETTQAQGVVSERILFSSSFSFEDQKEGMNAFAEKRKADFKNQ